MLHIRVTSVHFDMPHFELCQIIKYINWRYTYGGPHVLLYGLLVPLGTELYQTVV